MAAAGERVAGAVRRWLDGLDDDQRARATFPFDSAERFVWAYTPDPPREGLPIAEMRPDQRTAAMAIVATSASDRTAGEIGAIMALETILGGWNGPPATGAGGGAIRSGTGSRSSGSRARPRRGRGGSAAITSRSS
jgi:hypothetical protein